MTSLVLEFANKMYLQYGFELVPEYKQTLMKDFLSDIETTNFLKPQEAAYQINSWISNVTHNRVDSLIVAGTIMSLSRVDKVSDDLYSKSDIINLIIYLWCK